MGLLEVFIIDYSADPMCLAVRDGFYVAFGVMAFEIEVFWGVCFMVNICDISLYIYIYIYVLGSPHGIVVSRLHNDTIVKQVQTPGMLLLSLLDKCP